MIREILTYPKDKDILTQKSELVENVEDVKDLIQDLKDTLDSTKHGVGISAVQLGELKQVCVIKPEDNKHIVMINPKITKKEGVCIYKEGCLSVPDIYTNVQRARKVSVEYINEYGEKVRTTRGGLTGIVIQHELAHFDGWCEVFDAVKED